MDSIVPVVVSVVALIATLYQLHLQRVHNERSLKPLPQIDLMDKDGLIFVHVQNNGVGPLIIQRLTFFKEDQIHHRIQDCLALDPKSYNHIDISTDNTKVILPGNYLDVFSNQLNKQEKETELQKFRRQLSMLRLKVEGRDIYNNNIIVEKGFQWFIRHG